MDAEKLNDVDAAPYQREYKDRLFKYIFGRDTEDSKTLQKNANRCMII